MKHFFSGFVTIGYKTVHEMARDEARHGKALQGLLNIRKED